MSINIQSKDSGLLVEVNGSQAMLTHEEALFFGKSLERYLSSVLGHVMLSREFNEHRGIARLIDMCNTPCWRYRVKD